MTNARWWETIYCRIRRRINYETTRDLSVTGLGGPSEWHNNRFYPDLNLDHSCDLEKRYLHNFRRVVYLQVIAAKK